MKSLNCPNCGAPITSCRCEYCGTVFEKPDTVTLHLGTQKLADALSVEELYKSAIRAMRGYAEHTI